MIPVDRQHVRIPEPVNTVNERMENRYLHGEAARLIGTSKNTIHRWEKRAREVQEREARGLPVKPNDRIWLEFPVPTRNAHSRYREFTDGDIEQIKAWRTRTTAHSVL